MDILNHDLSSASNAAYISSIFFIDHFQTRKTIAPSGELKHPLSTFLVEPGITPLIESYLGLIE